MDQNKGVSLVFSGWMLAEVLLEPMDGLSQPNVWAGSAIGIICWETEAGGGLVTNDQTSSPGTQHWKCISHNKKDHPMMEEKEGDILP